MITIILIAITMKMIMIVVGLTLATDQVDAFVVF